MSDRPEGAVVIRDNDYYGGDIWVTKLPKYDGDICELTVTWVAYQGGAAQIVLQDPKELETLGHLLLGAAKTIDPDRLERESL